MSAKVSGYQACKKYFEKTKEITKINLKKQQKHDSGGRRRI